MTETSKQQPAHRVQFGNVKVAVWLNSNEQGYTFPNFGLTRSYKDSAENWQEQTISLNASEIAKVTHALNKAYQDYYTLPQFRKNDESTDNQKSVAKSPSEIEGQF